MYAWLLGPRYRRFPQVIYGTATSCHKRCERHRTACLRSRCFSTKPGKEFIGRGKFHNITILDTEGKREGKVESCDIPNIWTCDGRRPIAGT